MGSITFRPYFVKLCNIISDTRLGVDQFVIRGMTRTFSGLRAAIHRNFRRMLRDFLELLVVFDISALAR